MTAANLGRLMEPVARHLLGEPNKEFSDTTELRYGSHGSLAIDLKHGRWYDHEAQVGGGVLALVARNIGCGNGEAVEWLREQGFEVPGDTPRRRPFAERIVCTYRYLYADGSHAFDVVRLRDPKEFKQRAPDGTWRVKGIRKVLYRLPEILEAPEGATVFFVEGEKDVDRLFELGLRATTSPEGAGKWRDDYADALRLIRAAVVPDNDTSGAEHAQTVVDSFRRRDVSAAILRLPDLPPKGDVSDWLDAGGTRDQLLELAAAALEAPEVCADQPARPVDLWAVFASPALPRGLLPPVIEDFAFAKGGIMGADPGGLAAAALAVCAATLTDAIKLQVKRHDPNWLELARLWVALIGEPSTKKSPALDAAIRPLAAINAGLRREYDAAKAKWDKLPKEEKEQTDEPILRKTILGDTTIEAAQVALRDNPQGLLCHQDELAGWFGAMDKYAGPRGAAKDRGFWLTAYNGGAYAVDRISRGSCLIENLSVCVLGGIQPGPMRALASDGHDDGLFARICPLVISTAGVGRDEPMPDAEKAYRSLVEALHRRQPEPASRFNGYKSPGVALRRRRADHPPEPGSEAPRVAEELRDDKPQARGAHRQVRRPVRTAVLNLARRRKCRLGGVALHYHGRRRRPGRALHARLSAAARNCLLCRHARLSDDHDTLAAVAGYILARRLEVVTNRDVQRGNRTMRGLERRDVQRIFQQLEALGGFMRCLRAA